ncbi:MAG: cell division protein FtsQ [Roseburia sp.]|nr:cell division protein FtsQ [Roseburia sp.]
MIKEERRKRKRRKIQLYIFLTVTLLIALAAFIVVEVFTVEHVVVEGNEWYSSKQIEDMVLNDEYSWNSLYVTMKYRFIDIGEVPFVDEMEVSLDNPHTLRIKVYEKGILGYLYIPVLGQNAYFDKDGFVVETSANIIPGVPKVTGINCNEVFLYEKLSLEDESILRLLLNLTLTLEKYEVEPDEIAFAENGDAIVYYGDIRVIVGDEENLSQKIINLSAILKELSNMEISAGTLHLENWNEESADIVFDRVQNNQNP